MSMRLTFCVLLTFPILSSCKLRAPDASSVSAAGFNSSLNKAYFATCWLEHVSKTMTDEVLCRYQGFSDDADDNANGFPEPVRAPDTLAIQSRQFERLLTLRLIQMYESNAGFYYFTALPDLAKNNDSEAIQSAVALRALAKQLKDYAASLNYIASSSSLVRLSLSVGEGWNTNPLDDPRTSQVLEFLNGNDGKPFANADDAIKSGQDAGDKIVASLKNLRNQLASKEFNITGPTTEEEVNEKYALKPYLGIAAKEVIRNYGLPIGYVEANGFPDLRKPAFHVWIDSIFKKDKRGAAFIFKLVDSQPDKNTASTPTFTMRNITIPVAEGDGWVTIAKGETLVPATPLNSCPINAQMIFQLGQTPIKYRMSSSAIYDAPSMRNTKDPSAVLFVFCSGNKAFRSIAIAKDASPLHDESKVTLTFSDR